MIASVIAWSARNLLLILIGTVFAIAAGVYGLRNLPLDAIPDLSDVQAGTRPPSAPARFRMNVARSASLRTSVSSLIPRALTI